LRLATNEPFMDSRLIFGRVILFRMGLRFVYESFSFYVENEQYISM